MSSPPTVSSPLRTSGVPAHTASDLPPVVERFCRYVQIDTQSAPTSATFPSTAKQMDLSRLLVDELCAMDLADAELDEHGYVFATVPSSLPAEDAARLPTVGLVAHVDTSPDAPGANVRPLLHPDYDGAAFALPGDPAVTLDPDRQPALRAHLGHT
ncbi:MAG: peptidase T, partial [Rhodothermaceae bacterium]|nr:peptidase T [Rhodothermaceae bacterium]